MSAIVRTFTTRIDSHPALIARAELESRVERRLHAALRSERKFTGDLAVSFYQQFGISAKTLDGIHRQLKAKLSSIAELAKFRTAELGDRISAKRKQIANIEKALRRNRKKSDADLRHRLRCALHRHKRHLAILERRQVDARARIDDPRICFGSRRLFNAQHHLAANGLEDHKDWLRQWHSARSAQFFVEGAAQSPSGNQFVRLAVREDGAFDLELRLPGTLGLWGHVETTSSGRVVRATYFTGLRFQHGAAEIREALDSQKPLSYRFRRDDRGFWFVSIMLRQDFAEPAVSGFHDGCLGVDLNADHVALTLVDATGNPLATIKDAPGRAVMTRRIDLVAYGKTRAQRLDMIRKAAAEIARLADQLGVVAAEKLDFSRKRAELDTVVGRKRARMLSSFAYTAFAEALARVCIRRSVRLILVNPAYTSLIGRVKFAPRYGSSVHAAAALAIAVGRWPFPNDRRLPVRPSRWFSPPATASPSRDLQGSRGGMCGRRGASCREDCQRSMQDVGGRAAGRDRTAREVARPPAPPRRGRERINGRTRDAPSDALLVGGNGGLSRVCQEDGVWGR